MVFLTATETKELRQKPPHRRNKRSWSFGTKCLLPTATLLLPELNFWPFLDVYPYRISEAAELSPPKLAWKSGTPCLLSWKTCNRSLFSFSGSFSLILLAIFFCLYHVFHTFSQREVLFTVFGFLEKFFSSSIVVSLPEPNRCLLETPAIFIRVLSQNFPQYVATETTLI